MIKNVYLKTTEIEVTDENTCYKYCPYLNFYSMGICETKYYCYAFSKGKNDLRRLEICKKNEVNNA